MARTIAGVHTHTHGINLTNKKTSMKNALLIIQVKDR